MPGSFPSAPFAGPVVNRRRLLAGAGSLALFAVATPACGSAPTPPAVDELEAQRELARRDSELAAVAAAAVADSPVIAAALAQIAAERTDHARALTAEIARVAGNPEPSLTETSASATTTEPTAPAPTVSDVVNALRAAADSAAKLATEMSGYRAGLLASIAAACTAAYTVALAARP